MRAKRLDVVARTRQEIREAGTDEIKSEIQRFDDDGLEEPFPGPKVPGPGYKGTLLERGDVCFQGIYDSVNHFCGSLWKAVDG